MLVLQSSTYKGELDTLDDPECNFGITYIYYFCIIGQIQMSPGGAGEGWGDEIRDLLRGGEK